MSEPQLRALWRVSKTEENFASSRRCLASHYRANPQPELEKRALEDLRSTPSGRYDPQVLLGLAVLELGEGRFPEALKLGQEAERYQDRLPTSARYLSLVRIQEVQARAYEKRYATSHDPLDLERATARWEAVKDLAAEGGDQTWGKQAQTALARLTLLKRRLP